MELDRSEATEHRKLHVAIIMDGSGRWARARGRQRTDGHRAGAQAVRRVIEAAGSRGIGTLTLFAFSADNWRRTAGEVGELMEIFRAFFDSETEGWRSSGVRLEAIGRRERLPAALRAAIASAEEATAPGGRLRLRIAIDYSGREAILEAARRIERTWDLTARGFSRLLAGDAQGGEPAPDVDLLIRTGGERRLSDFMLWECAYAELFFTATPWPEFSVDDLEAALTDFYSRDRRFGRVLEPAGHSPSV